LLLASTALHQRVDGSSVDLVSCPAGPCTPPGLKGIRSVADVEEPLKLPP
jgi:hypothetical protein